jgi:uncharacterized protein with GYD domain
MVAGHDRHRQQGEEVMPLFITQGNYTAQSFKGMVAKPEDRTKEVAKLFANAGGKLQALYFTFGEYDFLLIAEAPDEKTMAAALMAAAAGGGVTNLKTMLAMKTSDGKAAFEAAGKLAASFRPAGT